MTSLTIKGVDRLQIESQDGYWRGNVVPGELVDVMNPPRWLNTLFGGRSLTEEEMSRLKMALLEEGVEYKVLLKPPRPL